TKACGHPSGWPLGVRRRGGRAINPVASRGGRYYDRRRSPGTLCVPSSRPEALCASATKGRIMNARLADPFGARSTETTPHGPVDIYRLDRLEKTLGVSIARLPFSIRILLEAVLRNVDGYQVTEDDVQRLAG